MGASLYYSFTSYDLLSSPRWVGLANYRFLFTEDPLFWQAVRNTLWIVVIGVPLRLAFAIFTAMLLTAKPARGQALPHALLPADAGAAGGRGARVRRLPEPRHRARRPGARGRRQLPAPLWFQDPA